MDLLEGIKHQQGSLDLELKGNVVEYSRNLLKDEFDSILSK
jgi:hypothetical protein